MNKKDLFDAFGQIDEKYIKEAEPKMKKSDFLPKLIGIAACLVIVVALSLYLFLPFNTSMEDLSMYKDSDYFPLIEKISVSLKGEMPYKNNFEYLSASITSIFNSKDFATGAAPNMGSQLAGSNPLPDAPPTSDGASGNGSSANGGKVDFTDNQVADIEEGDILKLTNKYIFRLTGTHLRVYSIAKEDSEEVGAFEINLMGKIVDRSAEMYLSDDGNTVTVVNQYVSTAGTACVSVIALDVSDVSSIKETHKFTIDGSYNSSRVVDGKLLLVTEFYCSTSKIDYSNPETYVPKIDYGQGEECVKFEDLVFPDNITGISYNIRYSVVSLIDCESLEMMGAAALLGFTDDIYVSENNVYVMRKYNETTVNEEENEHITEAMTDIAVLSYSGESLEKHGVINVKGTVKDKWSADEKDGYLRVVASTNTFAVKNFVPAIENGENVSLYIYDLKDNSLYTSVERFAPNGESAQSVRFDGDTLYVCTAVVITLTDPVYFFDLSDYSNITYTDTGTIDGFSSSLINLGEGFLLGIGQLDWQYSKVEVYEQSSDKVVSVAQYTFEGTYSTEYKSYYIDRENDLFGFAVDYYPASVNGKNDTCFTAYILLQFNGYELKEVSVTALTPYDYYANIAERIRSVCIDGYLYITGDDIFKVQKIS